MWNWLGYGVSLRLSPAFEAEVSQGFSARILLGFSGGLKARVTTLHFCRPPQPRALRP
jgi:hypothetical protein